VSCCLGDERQGLPRKDNLPWLFVSEQQAQLTTRQAVNHIVRVAGETAKLGRVWPHMLRHSCGYYLADQGTDLRTIQDYFGHRDPKHTAHYTRVAGHRFEGLWSKS
jgi:type 1 fimbriae regulatory protein FimB